MNLLGNVSIFATSNTTTTISSITSTIGHAIVANATLSIVDHDHQIVSNESRWSAAFTASSSSSSSSSSSFSELTQMPRPGAIEYNWWIFGLILFALFGIVGNVLVCLIIRRDPSLASIKLNYYLVSLAIADLAVCLIVIPLSIVQDFVGEWIFDEFLCQFWIFSDILLCTSSIYHLSTLAVLRFIAIQYPLKTKKSTSKRATCLMLVVIWTMSTLPSCVIFYLGHVDVANVMNGESRRCMLQNSNLIIYGSVFSFVIPLVIMIIMFALMVRKLRMQLARLVDDNMQRAAAAGATYPLTNGSNSKSNSLATTPTCDDTTTNRSSLMSAHHEMVKCTVSASASVGEPYQLRRHVRSSGNGMSSSMPASPSLLALSSQRRKYPPPQQQRSKMRMLQNLSLIGSGSSEQQQQQQQQHKHKSLFRVTSTSQVRSEVKALQVLGIVFISFVIAWLPFCLVNMLCAIFSKYKAHAWSARLQPHLGYLTYLGYVQSTVNPIIYTVFNRKFRKGFFDIIQCAKRTTHLTRKRKFNQRI